MTVTIAKYRDRIPTDKTAAEAASIHGAGSVFVDGKCYADILAEQAKPAEEVASSGAQSLDGSSTIDAEIDVNGAAVQLGTVVASAHTRSGLSVDEWNALSPEKRDELLNAEIALMRDGKAGE